VKEERWYWLLGSDLWLLFDNMASYIRRITVSAHCKPGSMVLATRMPVISPLTAARDLVLSLVPCTAAIEVKQLFPLKYECFVWL
jgi:hypothetical protein